MTRTKIAGVVCAVLLLALLVLFGVAAGYRFLHPAPKRPAEVPSSTAPAGVAAHEAPEGARGFLYGRVTAVDGASYEGRLRWGGDQEAFWGDFFNGTKSENPWVDRVPPERLPKEGGKPIEIFGFELGGKEKPIEVGRVFIARFGEIERVEAEGREVRVTLKGGTAFDLDRFEASDFDDGLRVWDRERGVIDLDSLQIRSVELLPTPALAAAPYRLQGTVRTHQGELTGFVEWDQDQGVGSDELIGRGARGGDGDLSLRFDTIRSIERRSRDSALVTLLDGSEIELSGTPDIGRGGRGLSVDDPRYGRVQVSWDAFEGVDFEAGGSGPGYDDFPPGRPLTGSVTDREGRRLAGRLVFDIDESETTDTLDADDRGLHYTLPFGLIAWIAPGPRGATVRLHDGEELHLEPAGDLRKENAGLLVFADGQEKPDYVPWSEVERIDLDGSDATDPWVDER